jgi:hypothetical protein
VERAVEMKMATKKDPNLDYDEVWCVFDIDEQPFVPEAKQQARDNRIRTAISNPWFELWMLLHFQSQRAYIDRALVQQKCRRYLSNYEKAPPTAELSPRYDEAVARATALDAWQASRDCEGENPSTGVYPLTERIKQLGRPRLIRS